MTTKNNSFYILFSEGLVSYNQSGLKQSIKPKIEKCSHCAGSWKCSKHKVFREHEYEETYQVDEPLKHIFPVGYRRCWKDQKFHFEKLPKDIQLMIFGYISRF